MQTPPRAAAPRRLPRAVLALGVVSLFMDLSSEMVHGLLPVFVVSVLGASATFLGVLEGVAQSTALFVKAFSGAISDRMRRRKPLIVAGYSLAAATKPLFALAHGVGLVFAARFVDRIGKGIRGAPRDALLADVTPQELRGAAYGLRQSMDTLGAVLGPLVAIVLMAATAGDFRVVFWVAAVPGAVAVLVLVLGVREPERDGPVGQVAAAAPRRFVLFDRGELRRLSRPYWGVVALGAVLHLARFSEAFLLLRAGSVGVEAGTVPVMLLVMSVVYAATAYPAGKLSDRIGRTKLLGPALLPLIAADVVLALASDGFGVAAGVALWGLHLGLSEGALSALVADTAPRELRGTAFGLFNLVSGLVLLLASVLAGWLWDQFGAPATFWAGGAFAALAAVGFLWRSRGRRT